MFFSYSNSNLNYPEPNYENTALIQKRMEESAANGMYPAEQYMQQSMHPASYPNSQNQYLYYPKPYSAANNSVKPIAKQPPSSQMAPSSNVPRAVPISQNNAVVTANARYGPQNGSNGSIPQQQQPRVAYNQNHWLLQEAELRRQLDSMERNEASSTRIKNTNVMPPQLQPQPQQQQQPHSKNVGGGFLSVSGKKKCSSCMDELGKGCAAMVVESLSLYYHINCFRCSVCNVQLGIYLNDSIWTIISLILLFHSKVMAPLELTYEYATISYIARIAIPTTKVCPILLIVPFLYLLLFFFHLAGLKFSRV